MENISGFTCLALCLLLRFGVESNLFIVCLLFVLLGHDRPDTSLIVVFMASSSKRTADIYLQ